MICPGCGNAEIGKNDKEGGYVWSGELEKVDMVEWSQNMETPMLEA